MMDKLQEWLDDMSTTPYPEEAIFIMEDGTLINGEFELGYRGLDHNCIISLADHLENHVDKWGYIHDEYQVVRLVPETATALIGENQELNDIQEQIVEYLGYEIERY